MDGNRRWAKQHKMAPEKGHEQGVEALDRVVREAVKLGIPFLTVYALSTENLKEREKSELKELFALIQKGLVEKIPMLKEEGVRIKFIGNTQALPFAVRQAVKIAEKSLAEGKVSQLNIALNYGSREEISEAAKKLKSDKATLEEFSDLLFTKDLPDPDLIIRTGGQKRLSNFLLWQAAYSELYFTDTLWPDFGGQDLKAAVEDFEKRKRNFGA